MREGAERVGVAVTRLVVWTGGTQTVSAVLPGPDSAATRRSVWYTVRSGDSLWSIANHFSVSVSDLKAWNDLSRTALTPGQRLKLEVDVTRLAENS